MSRCRCVHYPGDYWTPPETDVCSYCVTIDSIMTKRGVSFQAADVWLDMRGARKRERPATTIQQRLEDRRNPYDPFAECA